jgi:hypothetical protein
MNNFDKAFDAGRIAVKRRRTPLLLALCVFMGVDAAIREYAAHKHLTAVFALVFSVVIVPWLGWAWFKPKA